MKDIVIYGKPNCPFCDAAKRLLEQKQLPYTYKQLNVDFTREDIMALNPNARTYPQIFVDGEVIGGYDQLKEMKL